MIPGEFRDMSQRGRLLIQALLTPAFPGRDELARQLAAAKVRTIDEDGSLEFSIDSDTKLDNIKHAVPTEGEYRDPDRMHVHVLLHVRGDKAKELEFYRDDNQRVRTWPDPCVLSVFAPQ